MTRPIIPGLGIQTANWSCTIGSDSVDPNLLPMGCDLPMRQAIKRAYREITGKDAEFVFSGWSAKLTPGQRAVVDSQRHTIERTVGGE